MNPVVVNDLAPAGHLARGIYDSQLALVLHRRFLQEVLAEVLPALSSGERSPARLIAALQVYWEACFARRAIRKRVASLAVESQLEAAIEPLGRPFFHMIQSELWTAGGASANDLALRVYNETRAVAVVESNADKRMPCLRENVIAKIRASHPIPAEKMGLQGCGAVLAA